ncbi:MAG: hypothetical protein DKM50_03825 [Candidatus Margulisiibacteriota bacterium]|nr:MAG: hypothetical protein A2X43_01540 [Candidatus Margulisbacteria bacterium GWD2_39_127]OGI04530.1 MAG: hypothetical protein A2X42_10405 [Candidatus Margulisbacteria bacterium GWF2_38_17]OGI07115.1 MAG: hypothetical protein A2X41_12775 [Candidatus Margulisbacteria bacterium GWE2_39_32]PZM82265.1 MAG: hypothetical protein DKM50_03825 [Candidatus Margulisiibacteriota bacterium]HAR62989.1 hypothetical protein [Candidatus Margulisiibacteriota bacterium]
MNNEWINLKPNNMDIFIDSKVQYPVTFELKVIIEAIKPEQENLGLLVEIFDGLRVSYSKVSTNASKTGKYVSFSVKVTIVSKEIFDRLYEEIGKIPHVKAAI